MMPGTFPAQINDGKTVSHRRLLSIAKAALKRNLPIEEIMAPTGLSREKIQS